MCFEEALAQFKNALYLEFGVDDGVTEIRLSHQMFDRVLFALASKQKYGVRYSDVSDLEIVGVPIRAKERP